MLFAAAIGSCRILSWCCGLLSCFWRHTFRKWIQSPTRLYDRYGSKQQRSWAVVTGGSDGIGLAMCHQLAAQGFNICIVARNEQKMEEKLAEIRAKNQGCETKSIVADFVQLGSIEEYRAAIGEPLKDLDIGVLVANAGFSSVGPFADLTDSELEGAFRCNAMHVVYTIKVLASQLLERFETQQQKSGIMVVTSGLGAMPLPGLLIYSASKSFSSFIGIGLSYEMRGKVDVTVYQAGYTSTQLTGNQGGPVTPELAASRSFRDLGLQALTFGPFVHEVGQFNISVMPVSILGRLLFGQSTKMMESRRKREAELRIPL